MIQRITKYGKIKLIIPINLSPRIFDFPIWKNKLSIDISNILVYIGDMEKKNNEIEKIVYWLDLASYDLETAEAMLIAQRYLYVGFMCHQVIEKSLKACYIKKINKTPPRQHNLAYLAKESNIYDYLSEKKKDLLDELQPLNIEARYPTYREKLLESLSQEKCAFLIKSTKELFQWLKNQLQI